MGLQPLPIEHYCQHSLILYLDLIKKGRNQESPSEKNPIMSF